jgi:predicted aspartyl protease
MGDIYLELTIANISDPTRQKGIPFLADTGATRAWIPKTIADELGIEVAGTVPLEMVDGNLREFPYGLCRFALDGEVIAGNVVIGSPEIEPLVGTHVLQDFRMVIDMEHHTISRGRALRAK